jgi:hypothetical protein
VEDEAAARGRTMDGFGIAQIARYGFNVEFRDAAAGTHQRANTIAAIEQHARDMPAEEARSAGNQGGFHRRTGLRLCAASDIIGGRKLGAAIQAHTFSLKRKGYNVNFRTFLLYSTKRKYLAPAALVSDHCHLAHLPCFQQIENRQTSVHQGGCGEVQSAKGETALHQVAEGSPHLFEIEIKKADLLTAAGAFDAQRPSRNSNSLLGPSSGSRKSWVPRIAIPSRVYAAPRSVLPAEIRRTSRIDG